MGLISLLDTKFKGKNGTEQCLLFHQPSSISNPVMETPVYIFMSHSNNPEPHPMLKYPLERL